MKIGEEILKHGRQDGYFLGSVIDHLLNMILLQLNNYYSESVILSRLKLLCHIANVVYCIKTMNSLKKEKMLSSLRFFTN